MKVTRKVIDTAVLDGTPAHQHIQDTRWHLEEVAAKLLRAWCEANPEKLKEMLDNKQQAAYNAHTYDASLFILTPREAYSVALAAYAGVKTYGKTTEELLELAKELSPYALKLLESPPRN